MSDANQEINSLPLMVNKKQYWQIIGMLLLVSIVILVNIFGFKKDEKVEKKLIESYAIKAFDPVTQQHKVTTNVVEQEQLQQQLAEAKAKDFVERLQASQAIDGGNAQVAQTFTNQALNVHPPQSVLSQDPNTAFLQTASQAIPERSYAGLLTPRAYLIGQGKWITGNLTVAIHSDLPGQISARVAHDVYGEVGRNILIPEGSRLIGEYKSGLVTNQQRLFVVWTRVITPNGLSVMLGSPGTDALGQTGLTGDINNHYMARFGAASFISLLGAGAATVGVNPNDEYNSAASYRQAISQAMAQQASNTLNQTISTPPTIHIPQGEKIMIFVNKDLDFSRVYR